MYRWVPGNRTRIRTEPAPSELLKATGMQPITRRAEPVTPVDRWCSGARQERMVRLVSQRPLGEDFLQTETLLVERAWVVPLSSGLG